MLHSLPFPIQEGSMKLKFALISAAVMAAIAAAPAVQAKPFK